MEPEVLERLLTINRGFYQIHADAFAASRTRLQPGVQRLLDILLQAESILDLGCGSGTLASELEQRGFDGRYTGLDASEALLEHAASRVSGANFTFRFGDVSHPDWHRTLLGQPDVATAFAVLHHLPGEELREMILRQVHELLPESGLFVHSNWFFLNSEKWSRRVVPWDVVGLRDEQLDVGDYLLDWRKGGTGYRYVHHFSEGALQSMAEELGFDVEEIFYSDGEGGRLGHYEIWRKI